MKAIDASHRRPLVHDSNPTSNAAVASGSVRSRASAITNAGDAATATPHQVDRPYWRAHVAPAQTDDDECKNIHKHKGEGRRGAEHFADRPGSRG